MAKKKWIQPAIQKEDRVRKHFGVKEGETIPARKLDTEIERLHKKTEDAGGPGLTEDERSLLSALQLAKKLKGFGKGKKKYPFIGK